MNRRKFLRCCVGAAGGLMAPARSLLSCAQEQPAETRPANGDRRRKLIVVVFGGGTRFSESVGDSEHRYVPKLWTEMAPKGTLFRNVRVEGRMVHTNCTASLLTGHREYDEDNDWSRPPAHATVFEIVRKARGVPDTGAWAFVYASILAKVGESRADGYGAEFAANVVEPPTIARETAERMGALMQKAAVKGSAEEEMKAAREAARLARMGSQIARGGLRSDAARQFLDRHFDAWKAGSGSTSHDAFLAEGAIECMKRFAPDVLVAAFGEIDCAHYGSWSRYVEAIRRTDELTWRLWRAAEEIEAYQGRTLLLVVPDHGRELERARGMGYVHHSNFYTGENVDEGCRRVWMLAIGEGVAAGRVIEEAVPARAVAATGLEYLGLKGTEGAAGSLLNGELRMEN